MKIIFLIFLIPLIQSENSEIANRIFEKFRELAYAGNFKTAKTLLAPNFEIRWFGVGSTPDKYLKDLQHNQFRTKFLEAQLQTSENSEVVLIYDVDDGRLKYKLELRCLIDESSGDGRIHFIKTRAVKKF
ncbi:unnamed protein product [Caenorhabditis angaria]|uniref:DUF38 domain-containing protein n=1 Tax=Caenorhabditis angaria TaxID=860376 RepID=A0A9P1N5G4_9PELO|nr:unnamed protein product [Caenorhabditis angaria]